jgi:transposase
VRTSPREAEPAGVPASEASVRAEGPRASGERARLGASNARGARDGVAVQILSVPREWQHASVMCDGSPTNNCVERAGGQRGGCNAHARRGLVAALRGGDLRTVRGLELFTDLFRVEAESRERGDTREARFKLRQEKSVPIIEKLRAWVDQSRGEVEPRSTLGKALGYISRQWKRLTAFLRDPKMDLTNNEVERDLRRWVLDRKTWYFVGHEESARRAADALTLLTTCRKMGLDPRRYLRAALAKILAGEKDLTALLPETFARAVAQGQASNELAA